MGFNALGLCLCLLVYLRQQGWGRQTPTLTLPCWCRKARPTDQGTALKPHSSAPLLEPLSTPLGADISCQAHMLFEDIAPWRIFCFSFLGFLPPPFTDSPDPRGNGVPASLSPPAG